MPIHINYKCTEGGKVLPVFQDFFHSANNFFLFHFMPFQKKIGLGVLKSGLGR